MNISSTFLCVNFITNSIVYTTDSKYLLAGTNVSTVLLLNATTGVPTNNTYYVNTPVQQFSSLGPGIITFINTNGSIFKIY